MRLRTIAEDRKYTLAVDLDGTLARKKDHHTEEILEPKDDAQEVMKEVEKLPVTIIINTVRGDEKQIKDWLKEYGIPYDHINHNPDQPDGASDKIMADEYWDDRATGWPGLRKALARLKRKLNG
jgi:hypothetical protein